MGRSTGNWYRIACCQSQSQIPVYGFQYLHKIHRIITVQPFELPHKKETITAITVVSEIFHLIDTTSAVEIDVTGRFIIFIKRVQEIATYPPITGYVMLEYG